MSIYPTELTQLITSFESAAPRIRINSRYVSSRASVKEKLTEWRLTHFRAMVNIEFEVNETPARERQLILSKF
jgi:hypothetical protein